MLIQIVIQTVILAFFKKTFKASLENTKCDIKNVFYALHYAYLKSTSQNFKKIKIIVEFSANPSHLHLAKKPFKI